MPRGQDPDEDEKDTERPKGVAPGPTDQGGDGGMATREVAPELASAEDEPQEPRRTDFRAQGSAVHVRHPARKAVTWMVKRGHLGGSAASDAMRRAHRRKPGQFPRAHGDAT